MISDSVELCETEVCFLNIQLMGTNVWLLETHDVPPEGILNPKSLLQNRILETVPACTVLQYCPHSNNVCLHMCDVKYQSNQEFVTSYGPFLWCTVRAYLLTIKYRVVQFLPNKSISEQFESIHVTILQQISFLLWNDGHRCMEWILCRVVESSCLPTHNTAQHISSHDVPYRKTTKKDETFPSMVIFGLLLRKFWTQTWFC